MNQLIVSATSLEIRPFMERIRKEPVPDTDILVTGIGLTAATWHIAHQLQLKKYDRVIQAGVAGCFDNRIPLGSVLAIKQEAIADESVVELKNLKTLFDLKLVPQDSHPYKKGWLLNPHKDLLKAAKLKTVKGVSVNQISTDKKMIGFYREHFNPVTESMEGAALHYCCLMANTPFLQIRSISNYIGERNKKTWNMSDSIIALNCELFRIVHL